MIADAGGAVVRALHFSASMTWEILWALILGFALSGVVQAVVSKDQMSRLLPDDSPRSLGLACGLGAASSSCSYAAVALARSLFRRGANFTAAMAFQFASTNLVLELGILMALILGWQFTLGEFVGGPLMIVLLALAFRAFLGRRLVEEARVEAERGLSGRMEGHAQMDMSVRQHGSVWRRLTSPAGFTATANYFVMDWAAIWIDVVGGVLAFVFADLIVLPILDIYRKYYGWRMAGFLLVSFYATMAAAGLTVEWVFEGLGLIPG